MNHETMNHDTVVELLGAYALDAVDPDEAATIEAHLADCPRCREEMTQHYQTASMLATAGGDAPAHLWGNIAARLEHPDTAPVDAQDVLTPLPTNPRAGARRRLRPARSWLAPLAAVAAAAAIAVLAGEVVHLDHRVNHVAATTTNHDLSSAAESALLDPRSQRVVLDTSAPDSRPVAQVVTLPAGTAYLIDEGLDGLPDSQTYQLWAIIDGRPISVGLLGTHPSTVAFTVDSPNSVSAYAVTVEPSGGSIAPTRAPVAQSA